MKKALIIALSLLLILNVALLAYGATLGNEITAGMADLGDLVPPENPREYAHAFAEWVSENATADNGYHTLSVAYNPSKSPDKFAAEVDGWYDVFGEADPSSSILARYEGAALAANLIVPVTYNHNRVKQFRMASHIEVKAGGDAIISDNVRVRVQPEPARIDKFYLSLAWTGKRFTSFATCRGGFGDQAFTVRNMITEYDGEQGAYTYKFGKPSIESRSTAPEREIPAKTYDLLSFPIFLGTGAKAEEDINAVVDYSVIDGATVKVTAPTEEKPYYTLIFSEDPDTAQRKENLDYLNGTLGDQMSNITINKADFVVEIWESGLFRQVTADFDFNAKINGKQGDATASMTYRFYYDDAACDIVRYIEDAGIDKYLSEKNREILRERKKGN